MKEREETDNDDREVEAEAKCVQCSVQQISVRDCII